MKSFKIVLLGFSLLFGQMTFAQGSTQLWRGQGSVLTPTGDVISNYSVEIASTIKGSKTQIRTTYFYSDGSSKTVMQTLDYGASKRAFSLQSDLGNGSGACYGEGLCQMYVTDDKAHTYSTFSRQDRTTLQHLTNELQGAVLVHVYRQSLKLVK